MNPTPEHKEQAREIVEQWRFSVPRGQIGTVTDPQWDKLIDRIAAALSAKDAEIEQLKVEVLATIDRMKGKLAHRNQLLTDIAAVLRDLFLKEGIEVK